MKGAANVKSQYLKLCSIALFVLLLAGACAPAPTLAPPPTPVPPTPTPGPVDRVMALQNAFNKPAIDEAAALFLDDKVGDILQGLLLSDSLGVRDTLTTQRQRA
jgi:hypothetical protein